MKRSLSVVIGLILLAGLVWGVMAGRETAVNSPEDASVALGEPGLAFRYVEQFGTTETPYIEDGSHFNDPSSVTIDGSGNIWVSEWNGMRTSKFNASGVYQFSLGQAGFRGDDGEILGAVGDTAVDSSGNIWTAEVEDHRVVKFNSAGEYQSELGHKWNSGSDNDHFDSPRGLAFDSSGNLYVSDRYNHRIQIFNSSGTYIATLGVSGVSGADNAHFDNPFHISIDNVDRLYVADGGNHRVQIFDATNPLAITHITTLGVTGTPGSDNAHFDRPYGITADNSKIYVADINNQRVQIFNGTTYAYLDTLGTGSAGAGNNEFDAPSNVDVDASGNIYVSEFGNHRVQKFNSSYAYVGTMGVTGVPYLTTADYYNNPRGLATTPDGGLIVVEHSGQRVIKINAEGSQAWTAGIAGVRGDDAQHFSQPIGVAVAADGRIYVTEEWNGRVHILNADGTHHSFFTGSGQLNGPRDVAFDGSGNLYIVDAWNHRVQIYDSSLNYVATMGVTGESGNDNAHFKYPHAVIIDSAGMIYVGDADNDRIQVFNSNYVYQRTMGLASGGCDDAFDRFCGAHDVAVDAQDRLYVADTWNNRVQVYDSTGAYLTTIGGSWGGRLGDMRSVEGVAVDSSGNVYISDSENHLIYKYTADVPGWKQVNLNGFGKRENRGAWAFYDFNDALYVSTLNDNGGEVHRFSAGTWSQVVSNGFGDSANNVNVFAEFNGSLYAGTWNYDSNDNSTGGQIWRSPSGNNGSWQRVVNEGFGDATNCEIMSMMAFNGYLYAGTWSCDADTHGAEIWRSTTGNNGSWVRVVDDTIFGDGDNAAILSMEIFNNNLYVVTDNSTSGGEVWRTSNGTTWVQVNTDGFGSGNNTRVVSLAVFAGDLYAGTWNSTSGGQIWRSTNGSSWSQVVGNGFNNVNNKDIGSLISFDSKLYAVVGNFETGAEVWRSSTGSSGEWELVIAEGFGGGRAAAVDWDNGTAVHNNNLYVGTFTWGNGGGRVWQLQRQVFLPMIVR